MESGEEALTQGKKLLPQGKKFLPQGSPKGDPRCDKDKNHRKSTGGNAAIAENLFLFHI